MEGFQINEAAAIEYELQQSLKKYIEDQHPYFTAMPAPMKKLYDPYTDMEITDLDAAFILQPYQNNPDHKRCKEHGIAIPQKKQM